ncbi:MAG: hypothetical protein R3C68_10270 [Myxococcota bacterium]
MDIALEILRLLVAVLFFSYLTSAGRRMDFRNNEGWTYIQAGFVFLCFGMLLDITDNFDALRV